MFQGRIAVISGASSGIGACLARSLSERGAHVVLLARSRDKLEEVGRSLQGPWDSFVVDVASFEQVCDSVEQVMTRYGRIDILINNAGFGIFLPFLETPLESIVNMMRVNYLGTVHLTKAVLPHMLERNQGHIVNIASMAGKVGTAKTAAYSATKHAVLGFTNSLRQELRGTGIHILAVNPGPVDTAFFDQADPKGNYVKNVGRWMLKPEQVASRTLEAMARGKTELNLPRTMAIGAKLYQLFPHVIDKYFHRLINKK